MRFNFTVFLLVLSNNQIFPVKLNAQTFPYLSDFRYTFELIFSPKIDSEVLY